MGQGPVPDRATAHVLDIERLVCIGLKISSYENFEFIERRLMHRFSFLPNGVPIRLQTKRFHYWSSHVRNIKSAGRYQSSERPE